MKFQSDARSKTGTTEIALWTLPTRVAVRPASFPAHARIADVLVARPW